jgi:hypothetical protein
MKHRQNNKKSMGKSVYQPMDFENLKKKLREPKVSRLLPNVCDSQRKKFLRKSIT